MKRSAADMRSVFHLFTDLAYNRNRARSTHIEAWEMVRYRFDLVAEQQQ